MKHFSLAFLTIGIASATVATAMWKKSHTDGHLVIQAAKLIEETVIYRDSVRQDTVWAVKYRTKYVFVQEPVRKPDVYFTDTSYLSIPERAYGTKFQDSISVIQLQDWVRPPKQFVLDNDNVYLAATVLPTGVDIDSLSVKAKLSFSTTWRKNVAEIGVLSANPYITGLPALTLTAKRLCSVKL